MNIDQLEEFCTVVRFQNITKAAEYMYLSQPTLSRHLAELEQALGAELLERGNSRVFTLTRAGELLFQEGEKILHQLKETEFHVHRAASGVKGNLRVCSGLLRSPILDRILYMFPNAQPDIDLQYFCLEGGPLYSSLMNGYADTGLSYSYEVELHGKEMDTLVLSTDHFCAVVSEFHPLAREQSVTVERLQKETMIMVREPEIGIMDREPLQGVMTLFRNNAVMADARPSMVLQTRINKGFCVLPYTAAVTYNPGCKVLEIADLNVTVDLVLMWKRENKNPSLPIFLAYAKEFLAQERAGS